MSIFNMNLQQLIYFVDLAQTEHMTKTAQNMNTSQPNISYAITKLEEEVGVSLFSKKGRQLQLTNYGKTLYKGVQTTLTNLERIQDQVREMADPYTGTVHIGFVPSLGRGYLPDLITKFNQSDSANPGQVKFTFYQDSAQEVVDLLEEATIDIAISTTPSTSPDIQVDEFLKEELVLVVPSDHKINEVSSSSIKDLVEEETFIFYPPNTGISNFVKDSFQKTNIKVKNSLELDDDFTILAFISNGFGISIMPDLNIPDQYPVKKIQIQDLDMTRAFYLMYPKESTSPASERFIDFLTKI